MAFASHGIGRVATLRVLDEASQVLLQFHPHSFFILNFIL